MKKSIRFVFLCIVLLLSCNSEDDDDVLQNINYRQQMRDFVIDLSNYVKLKNADFIIIPQNGQELVTTNGEENGPPETNYLAAIDGIGREDLFYGYDEDNIATPAIESDYMLGFLNISKQNNVSVLVTDYCYTHNKMDNSYQESHNHGFISFAAPDRELRVIPEYPSTPYNTNTNDVNNLSDAQNFLYLLNSENFQSKEAYLNALMSTNYDVLIIDCFYNETALSPQEISNLKTKKDGGNRLVISYISIGEAEDYRYYWKDEWFENFPDWIVNKNPDWPDNYVVKYWEKDWQDIIFGNNNAYLDLIINAQFDGAYLDIIDAFEYFEMFN